MWTRHTAVGHPSSHSLAHHQNSIRSSSEPLGLWPGQAGPPAFTHQARPGLEVPDVLPVGLGHLILLTAAHNLLAALLVSVLQWDGPDEWPALFGSITEAYSLRRFWGRFWHRLHVTVFEAYLMAMIFRSKPPQEIDSHTPITTLEQQKDWQRKRHFLRHGTVSGESRALWMFIMSAICHTASKLGSDAQIQCSARVSLFPVELRRMLGRDYPGKEAESGRAS